MARTQLTPSTDSPVVFDTRQLARASGESFTMVELTCGDDLVWWPLETANDHTDLALALHDVARVLLTRAGTLVDAERAEAVFARAERDAELVDAGIVREAP